MSTEFRASLITMYLQVASLENPFEYVRSALHWCSRDVMDWLSNNTSASHVHLQEFEWCGVHKNAFTVQVVFANPRAATEFKLLFGEYPMEECLTK